MGKKDAAEHAPRTRCWCRHSSSRGLPFAVVLPTATLMVTRPAMAGSLSDHLVTVVTALIVPLVLAALVLLGVLWGTYRRERKQAQHRQPATPRRLDVRSQVRRLVKAPPPKPSPETGPMLAVAEAHKEAPKPLVPSMPPAETKICTVCQREYRSSLVTCPFDRGRLVTKSSLKGGRRRDDVLDTQRSSMLCEACARQYDLAARYCLYDGKALVPHEEEDEPVTFDSTMICPRCGAEYDEDSLFCPEDGEQLLPEQLDIPLQAFGTMPIVICPQCMAEYPATSKTCPKDGHELLVLVGRKTGGSPTHGLGPKKKVCPLCGGRFGTDALFCSLDGSKLLSVN